MFSIGMDLDKTLDLTTPSIIKTLGTSVAELTQARIPRKAIVTQELGREAAALNIDGLIVWSAQTPSEKNLVILKHDPPPYVVITKVRARRQR